MENKIKAKIEALCMDFNEAVRDKDDYFKNSTFYRLQGAIELAEILGYVIYARHRNDLAVLPIEWFTIAKDGEILLKEDIKPLTSR